MLSDWPGRLRRRLFGGRSRKSYAQCGEDLIARFLLQDVLGRSQIRYLDIGAHDPWFLSNTALFYEMGFHGVCVEANPRLWRNLKRHRRRDLCLNAGVAPGHEQMAEFYVLSASTLGTFSRQEAERYVAEGHSIEATIRVPLLSANTILERHFEGSPELLSIDVEGLDEGILRSIDFDRFRPDVLCVETAAHSTKRAEWKPIDSIRPLMESRRYFPYASTFINTLFVNRDIW